MYHFFFSLAKTASFSILCEVFSIIQSYMNQKHRLLIAIGLIVLSTLYVFPWDKLGITPPAFLAKPYTLGLDLQ